MTKYEYANVGAILNGSHLAAPAPTVGLRDDGVGLFYRGQENQIIGDPETAKTLMVQCVQADMLSVGGSALIVDIDHNGVEPTLARLISMGVDPDVLSDPQRFRYAAPNDAEEMLAVVADLKDWVPDIALVDSIGELMVMFHASSNSPDDYTAMHSAALKPFAVHGSALVTIDHLAKNSESQSYGATGTAAKKRAVGGVMLRSTVLDRFTPGNGGRAQLTIVKDRHGGLRAASPKDDREPLAAIFKVWSDDSDDTRWQFKTPDGSDKPVGITVREGDVDALAQLVPSPISQRDVKERLSWGSTRALHALRAWRDAGSPTVALVALPAPQTPMSGAREHVA
ncbi:hypothetical protein [Leifsonia sp. Leaf336]|uniref:hypothetical protein n=1 Tax=Leifsonia sp. Leaf336 TaxID=1736341 RepID=UPI000AF1CCF8|nr:hypothetical protein [Leifsonia sp. Leaf336]